MKRIENYFKAWPAAWVLIACVPTLIAVNAADGDLDIGDAAPGFALQGSDGKVHELSDYRGQAVVLAWFPKAFTGG